MAHASSTGSVDQTAKVWDAETGKEIRSLSGHTSFVVSVAFSPDGKRIVTGSFDNTAKVWEAENGKNILSLKRHIAAVSQCGVQPRRQTHRHRKREQDGEGVGRGEGPGNLLPQRAQRYCLQRGIQSQRQTHPPTGSEDKIGKGVGRETSPEVLSLKGHTQPVVSVAFSPDGKRIFAWDVQKNVRAWSADDGKPVEPDNPPAMPPPGIATQIANLLWPGAKPDNPPAMPPPGIALSPNGMLRAEPTGITVAVFDTRRFAEDNFWPLPDAAERRRYHTGQATLAEKEKQWFAVAFHLGRLLLDEPDDVDLKRRREEALRNHVGAVPVGPPPMEKAP